MYGRNSLAIEKKAGLIGQYGDRVRGTLDSLWPHVIVCNSPRDTRPAVVELPNKCPRCVFFAFSLEVASPKPVGGAKTLSLHDLSIVDVRGHVESVSEVLHEIELETTFESVLKRKHSLCSRDTRS